MNKQTPSRKRLSRTSHQSASEKPNLKSKMNPLLIEVILEQIFNILSHAESTEILKPYRFVCKIWNQEIAKVLRRKTQTKLENLLLPYPIGMGWQALEGEKFQYDVPSSEIVRPFENIYLNKNCWEIFPAHGNKMENWFELMGNEVKGLDFEFTEVNVESKCLLLENIFKKWCPNLQSITLSGVLHIRYLIFISFFVDTDKPIICKDLKEVKLFGKIHGNYDMNNHEKYIFILSKQFNQFIYQHGLPGSSSDFPECRNSDGIKVMVPRDILNQSEFPDISRFVPQNFFPDNLDGGILGQLMSCTFVEKFSMKRSVNPENFGNLVRLFHYQKNCWRSSLKHLELDVSKMENISQELVVLAKLNFPIQTILLKEDFDEEDRSTKSINMTRFLAHFMETLQVFKYKATIHRGSQRSTQIILPVLPNLKTFNYENDSDLEICPINILTNLPNLEKLYLKSYSSRKSSLSNHIYNFFENDIGNEVHEHLTELRMVATISGVKGCKLLKWFPKVVRMTIQIYDTDVSISPFLRQLGNSQVKHLVMTLSTVKTGNVLSNTDLIRRFSRLKSLESLDLRCETDRKPFSVMLSAFSEGFGMLTELQLLKLTNFGVFKDEEEEIRKCVANIPVVEFAKLSYNRASMKRSRNMNTSRFK